MSVGASWAHRPRRRAVTCGLTGQCGQVRCGARRFADGFVADASIVYRCVLARGESRARRPRSKALLDGRSADQYSSEMEASVERARGSPENGAQLISGIPRVIPQTRSASGHSGARMIYSSKGAWDFPTTDQRSGASARRHRASARSSLTLKLLRWPTTRAPGDIMSADSLGRLPSAAQGSDGRRAASTVSPGACREGKGNVNPSR